ncbi:MAG: hypothetical protein R3D55_18130 [Chloroflexota bacterium]
MRPRHLIFLLVLLTIFAACNGDTRPTPTPFGSETTNEETPPAGSAQSISISDLAADPEAYANTVIELTGQYRRLPLLICQNDPHPSPATWQLMAEDGSVVAIGGFDSQVRSLLPDNLTVMVSGIWQLFEGPVGCGKDASSVQIWYLKAGDILSPSPIARVTLTPTGSASQIADSGGQDSAVSTPDNPDNLPPTATAAANPGAATNTPSGANTSVPSVPGTATNPPTSPETSPGGPGGSQPTDTPSPTFTTDPNETSTATPAGGSGSPTATATGGTVTPTNTGGTGGGNPTPTSSVLSTATQNPNNFDIVEFDDLLPETPVLELLAAAETHQWPMLLENTGAVTVTAVAEPTMNIVLEILDPANDVVQQANNGGNGALESIVNLQLNLALDYKIRIYDLNAAQGDYCLIFNEGGGFPDTIKGRIAYGQTLNNTLEVLGIDYWCFMGTSGDNITITASPTGTGGDLAIGLFGPPDFAAIGDVFDGPTLTNVTLADDGMYVVGILDFESQKAGYSITITKN